MPGGEWLAGFPDGPILGDEGAELSIRHEVQ